MTDQSPEPDADDHAGVGPGPEAPTGMPRWVKVFLIIVVVLVVAFLVSILAGVRHGPGLHTPDGLGVDTAPRNHGVE